MSIESQIGYALSQESRKQRKLDDEKSRKEQIENRLRLMKENGVFLKSEQGKKLLDLMRSWYDGPINEPGDPYQTAYNVGQRDVFKALEQLAANPEE